MKDGFAEDKDHFFENIIFMKKEIEEEYEPERIKMTIKSPNSLVYSMAISGHLSEKEYDYDDVFYKAGCIVLLQCHLFDHINSMSRLIAYFTMEKMGILLDDEMEKDYELVKAEYPILTIDKVY